MTLLEFLQFRNWASRNEHKDPKWTIVARSQNIGDTSLFTFSLLARTTSETNIDKILLSPDWIVHLDFGHPEFWKKGNRKRIYFTVGNTKKN
ncbi:hypothetical protein ACFLW9_01445 [Chloroflexota bacterium]